MAVCLLCQVCILESLCHMSARLTPPDAHAHQIVHRSVLPRQRRQCAMFTRLRDWRESLTIMCCMRITVAGAAAGATPEASCIEANEHANAPEAESSGSLTDTHSGATCQKKQAASQSTLQTPEGHVRGAPQEQAPYSASFKEVVPAEQSPAAMSLLCALAHVDSRCRFEMCGVKTGRQ